MNQITEEPNEYDFGLDFDYSVWTADTEVTLCNVPWGNDYRDVVEDVSEVNRFIDASSTEKVMFGNFAHVRPNALIKVPLPHNAVNGFNYVRVRNKRQPVTGDVQQDYFYFILDVKYDAPQTTGVILQLDAWTTYRHRVTVNRAFVERGHIGIANVNAEDDNGRTWLTTPEGFDTGTDYVIADQKDIYKQYPGHALITSATSLIDDPGTVDNAKLRTAEGGYVQSIPTATSTYVVAIQDLPRYLSAMKAYPWVTNGIIKVVITPNLTSLGFTLARVKRTNNYPPGQSGQDSYLQTVTAHTIYKQVPYDLASFRSKTISELPARYRKLTKFTKSPYCFYEVSNLMGSSTTYRPELFNNGEQLKFTNVGMSLVPGGERIEFAPTAYNTSNGVEGESYDAGVVTGNLPNLPVVNDNAINALANTAHGRSAARSNAAWAQQLALAGNENAYDGAALSASTSLGNDAIMRNLSDTVMGMNQTAAKQEQVWSNVATVGMGALGGAVGGGVGVIAGAAVGGAKAAMDTARMNRTHELDRNRLSATNAAGANISQRNYDTSTTINESNKGLADFAAKGNYEQAIAAMNASVQDTMLTQPGMSGGFGGEFFRVMAVGFTFKHRLRMIDQASIARIGEHWLRYGYAIRAFIKIPANLLVMDKFTYWKMSEVYLSQAKIPELYKRTIVGILEKGVTVWNKPEEIGNIDTATNTAKPNVRIER